MYLYYTGFFVVVYLKWQWDESRCPGVFLLAKKYWVRTDSRMGSNSWVGFVSFPGYVWTQTSTTAPPSKKQRSTFWHLDQINIIQFDIIWKHITWFYFICDHVYIYIYFFFKPLINMLTISIETYFLSVDFGFFILWSSNHIAARQSSEALWHRSWLPAISLPPMRPWRLGLGHQHHNGLISWTYEASVDTHFQGEDPIPWKDIIPWKTGKWCFKIVSSIMDLGHFFLSGV